MNVQPLVLNFTTARQQAEYFFNREFNTVSNYSTLIGEDGILEICQPSNDAIYDEFLCNNDLKEAIQEYTEEQDEEFNGDYHSEEFKEWFFENSEEWEAFKDEFTGNHYPMWNAVFRCDDFYINSDYCDIDKLYALNIGVLEANDEHYLFINGAGYDFYDAHWIPLFKMLGWIKEVSQEEE